MKAAPFSYERPTDVDGALELLADPDAKVLGGGQSLTPMMAMRLVRPHTLVDISGLVELQRVDYEEDWLRVGGGVTQRRIETDARACAAVPLLGEALPHVGHREIRNRGTFGGSLAHADPCAELLLVAVTLGALIVLRGPGGERTIAAEDFCTGPFATRLEPGELVTRVDFPLARSGQGCALEEVARRHGDYALCGVAVWVRRDGDRLAGARVGLMGAGPSPVVHDFAERLGPDAGTQECEDLAAGLAKGLEPGTDVHASGDYRRRLVRVLTARGVRRALAGAAR